MEKVGEILHVIHGDRAIAKVKVAPKIGLKVFDMRGKPIGVVLDVFGPVKSPYIEVKVEGHDPKKVINSPIYFLSKTKSSAGKR